MVLGATGHLGQAVVRRLVRDGYSVTAATRRSHPPELEGLAVAVARGTTDAPGQLDSWVRGQDLVVDAGAPSPLRRFAPRRPGGVGPIRHAAGRTHTLIDAVRRHGAVLVFVSSFVTLPRPRGPGLGAVARWRRLGHPYFLAKSEMERIVLDAARAGLPATVLNPGAFLGPWAYRTDTSLVHHVLTGRVPIVADTVVNVLDVRDVARYAIAAAEAGLWGSPIGLAGHDVRLVDLVRRIAELGGVPAATHTVSATVAEAWALWGEAALAWVGIPAPSPWLAAALIADATSMDASPEQRALDVSLRPLEDTLIDSVAWHRNQSRAG